MKLILTLAIFFFAQQVFAQIPGENFIQYDYKLTAVGKAPAELSIAGFDDPHFARNCKYTLATNQTVCEGTIYGLAIIPVDDLYLRAGTDTDHIQLTIAEKCSADEWLPLEDYASVIERDPDDPDGLFYDKLDVLIDPCHIVNSWL
jgi:hypothetical protein